MCSGGIPSAVTVPARPESRVVVAGSAAARKPLDDTMPQVIGKEGLMLSKYGEAMHTLQDSWSYAGVPGVPEPGAGISCNPVYASAPPPGAAGSPPHGAALTLAHRTRRCRWQRRAVGRLSPTRRSPAQCGSPSPGPRSCRR